VGSTNFRKHRNRGSKHPRDLVDYGATGFGYLKLQGTPVVHAPTRFWRVRANFWKHFALQEYLYVYAFALQEYFYVYAFVLQEYFYMKTSGHTGRFILKDQTAAFPEEIQKKIQGLTDVPGDVRDHCAFPSA
jgi:hypothetical protein